MLKENTYQCLKTIKNECNKKSCQNACYKFSKNDKYQKYRLYLEKLSDWKYIQVLKKLHVDHELWMIKIKPKGFVYIKCYESVEHYEKKYYIETETENLLSPLPLGVWGQAAPNI